MSTTFVTCLIDIGRGDLKTFNRSYDHYVECFIKLLKVLDAPMVIYCDDNTEKTVWQYRDKKNTQVIKYTVDDLKKFPFFTEVDNIRKNPEWYNSAGWLPESPQAKLQMYNPLVFSKQFMLNDCAIRNVFNTDFFAWIDAGIFNTVNLNNYFDGSFIEKLESYMERMIFISFPYDGKYEVHGFNKQRLNEYAGFETDYVIRGGFFGGTRECINKFNEMYYTTLKDTLKEGYMGTEESIFTIIVSQDESTFNRVGVDSNGLIYKFFELVSLTNISNSPDVMYVLTYDTPEQFKLWVEHMISYDSEYFKKVKKIVINNTEDNKKNLIYEKLFKEYDFTEYRFNNIGINRGRVFAANHFNTSEYQYMTFFEDDMLINNTHTKFCKSGLKTHVPNIFKLCKNIIKKANVDFVKFSFSEFYGDNTDDWAWYNVPKNKREIYFKNGDKKTFIKHLDVIDGQTYGVGHFHYCNWPIMINKSGNKKIFIDVQFDNPYEQTLMSFVKGEMHAGRITSACLLASPITHNRKYHYYGKRKEN